jgi:arsenate reductase
MTLGILEENQVDPEIVKYLETPPDRDTLIRILQMLGIENDPRKLMRKGEKEYKENNLADEGLSSEDLIDAMLNYPKLIERPIVIKGNKAIIGRPPESVLKIL